MTREVLLDSAHGEGRLVLAEAEDATTTLLLSHGAGGGIEARDLAALAAALPGEGVSVALFEQPWRRAGRKVASPPATLDAGLVAACAALRQLPGHDGALIVGGRSAGARSALRTAGSLGADGVLALAFPLHPPGRPESSRLPELLAAGVPTLVVQGTRDPFGRPEELPDPLPDGIALAVVPDADHGFAVPKSSPLGQDDVLAVVVESALEWIVREIVGNAEQR